MSAILLDVNYIPRYNNNWPTGFSGYICGTIPFSDAPCAATESSNIGTSSPQTFAQCCNGPITNITSSFTSSSVSCLAYCTVDFSRTIDNGTGVGFGDYWDCLSNRTDSWEEEREQEEITGSVTCGWVDTDDHDVCEASVSVEKSYYSVSTAAAAMGNATATAEVTGTKTWSECPAALTASATEAPVATATRSTSYARPAREVRGVTIGTGALMLGFGLLFCT